MRPTSTAHNPQTIEITPSRRPVMKDPGDLIPSIPEHAVHDFVHGKGSDEKLRARYRCSRRNALLVVLYGLSKKVLELERRLEARDGFGRRVGPQSVDREWSRGHGAA